MASRTLSGAATERIVKESIRHWDKVVVGSVISLLAAVGAFIVARFIVQKRRVVKLERTQRYLDGLEAHRNQLARRLKDLQARIATSDAGVALNELRRTIENYELELTAADQVIASFKSQAERLVRRVGKRNPRLQEK